MGSVKRRRLNPKDASDDDDEVAVVDGQSSDSGEFENGKFSNDRESSEGDEEGADTDSEEDDILQKHVSRIDFGTLASAQRSLAKPSTSGPPKSSKPTLRPPIPSSKLDKPRTQPPKSKNAPLEMSSKVPVSRKYFLPSMPRKSRDPRFEQLTPSTQDRSFRQAYSFLESYQHDEMAALKHQIERTKTEKEREGLKKTLQSLKSKNERRRAKDRAAEVLREKQQEEWEKVKKGKQPFYLKKSEQKKLVMEDKYDKMGKKRLEKLLERKRKKKEQKELRRMPRQR